MSKNKLTIIAVLFCLWIFPHTMQAQLKANIDNVFALPGSSTRLKVLQNDNPGDCPMEDVTVSIVTAPAYGASCVVDGTNNTILYTPVPGFIGKDVLTYKITCGALTAVAQVNIFVYDKPDNVVENVCYTTPPGSPWGLDELNIPMSNKTLEYMYAHSEVLVGDLNGDGIPEIIAGTGTANSPTAANGINIYNNKGQWIKRISTAACSQLSGKYGLAKVKISNGVHKAIIVAAASDNYLYAYDYNGTLVWKSDQIYNRSGESIAGIGFADFNGDGYTELYINNRIYDAATGVLLCTGGTGNKGNAIIYSGQRANLTVAADVTGDSQLELLAGNQVYNVSITNRTGVSGNAMSPAITLPDFTMESGATAPRDGITAVSDIDLDGNLDIVVQNSNGSTGWIYVWSPSKNKMLARKTIPTVTAAMGVPLIGDIDGDGKPEIVFMTVNTPDNAFSAPKMWAFKYDGTTTLKQSWCIDHDDYSGFTGMTLFDFNQDKISEIVYRDNLHMRIMNASGKSHLTGRDTIPVYDLTRISCPCNTAGEYAIVADLGDGSSKIITSTSSGMNIPEAARLRIFQNQTYPWAPARPVWNQYAYNPLFVNKDLTIPAHPMDPASIFTRTDGSQNRPFNNFLQQATSLNSEGDQLFLAPNLEFEPVAQSFEYDDVLDIMTVKLFIHNSGSAPFVDPIPVGIYTIQSNTYQSVYQTAVNQRVEIGASVTLTFTISNYSTLLPVYVFDNWVVALNAKDQSPAAPTFYKAQAECTNWDNRDNMTSNISLVSGERVMCQGTTETLKLNSVNSIYTYKWYNASTGGTLLTEGTSYSVTKDASTVQTYYVDVYAGAKKLTFIRDKVYAYLSPDSLVWTGAANDGNWHNVRNWRNPNDLNNDYPMANVPRKCTNVLIPDGLNSYPNLTDGATNYSYYTSAGCSNITFRHGGEVVRTDKLDYNKAFVQLSVNSNRYYMLSTPLKSMFSGDFYVKDANPHNDDIIAYTKLFGQTNPETGDYIEGNWTGTFNRPDVSFSVGNGLALWVDDKQPNTSVHNPFVFNFPKKDTFYQMYMEDDDVPNGPPIPLNRTKEHRFIYEDAFDQAPVSDILISQATNKAGVLMLVGNPFMAHLDFEKFYQANSSKIKNRYQVLHEDGSILTYQIGATNPDLTKEIAPMQSFLVESNTLFSSLVVNADMTVSTPQVRLRSSDENEAPESLLIEASMGKQVSGSLLMRDAAAANNYESNDVIKVFMKENDPEKVPLSVYTRSTDKKMLDINHFSTIEDLDIPVGIRTPKQGKFYLNFIGLPDFAVDYDVSLIDAQTGLTYDLRENNVLQFEKSTADQFLDNRFILSFKSLNAPTGIEETNESSKNMVAYSHDGQLRISTRDGSLLQHVTLYDLQGSIVSSKQKVNNSSVVFQVEKNKAYIVRAVSEQTATTIKVLGK